MKSLIIFILCSLNLSLAWAQDASLQDPEPRVYNSFQGAINIEKMENAMSGIFSKYLGANSNFHIRKVRWTYDPLAYVNYGFSAVNPLVPGTQAEYTIFFTSHEYSGNHEVKCRLIVWDGLKTLAVTGCESPTSKYWSTVAFKLKLSQVGL